MRYENGWKETVALVLLSGAAVVVAGCERPREGANETTTIEVPRAAVAPAEIPTTPEPTPAELDAMPPIEPRHAYLDGIAARKEGRFEDAERYLVAAGEYDPNHVKTWVNLARVRMDLVDPTGALEAAETGLGIDPASAQAMHQKGRALAALNRWDEAIAVLETAREAEPGNGWIANTLGWTLIQSGRHSDAVPALEAAREALPEVAFVRNNLGVAYERVGRLDEAIVEYRAAVAQGDSAGKAAMSLARLGATESDTAIVERTGPEIVDVVVAEKP